MTPFLSFPGSAWECHLRGSASRWQLSEAEPLVIRSQAAAWEREKNLVLSKLLLCRSYQIT